jgi:hypothetical protein
MINQSYVDWLPAQIDQVSGHGPSALKFELQTFWKWKKSFEKQTKP